MSEKIELEVTGFQSLRAQLKDANNEVQKMVALYGELSPQTIKAAKNAAELKDQIDDARDAVAAFTGAGKIQAFGKAVQGVAGAFTAAQGAIGLFGGESKDLEKVMLKVQSAMALTQGLAALEDVGRAFGTLKSVVVSAFNGIKAAIGSSGIGLLLLGITAAVVGLMNAFDDADEAEKKNKDTVDSLADSYKKLQDQISKEMALNKRNTDLKIAEAERDKKSIAEIAKIREDASYEEAGLVAMQITKLQGDYSKKRKAALDAARAEKKDLKKAEEDFQADYEKQISDLNERLYSLDNERKIAAIKLEMDLAAERKKIADEAKKKREDQAKNEKESLYALNEARRALYLAHEKEQKEIIERTYANQLERLKEQKEKELSQENLTAKAKQNIDKKYNYFAQTARIERDKGLEDLDKKAKADAEARQKDHEQRMQDLQERRYQRSVKVIDDYFTYQKIALDESGVNIFEYNKKAEELELARLEKQLALAEKNGEDTTALEKAVSDKKKQIKDKEVSDAKARNQALLSAASDLAGALQSLSQAQMSQELAAAEGNAEKQEQIKKDYFEKDKNFQYAKTSIAGIQAGMQAFAQGMEIGGPVLAGVLLAASAATTLIQLAAIANTQYVSTSSSSSKSDKTKGAGSQYADGGLLGGPSHDLGGIKTSLGELEGGEFVINRRATMDFLPILQAINKTGQTPGPEKQMSMPIIKTYVVASEMSSQQEANAQLSRIARL